MNENDFIKEVNKITLDSKKIFLSVRGYDDTYYVGKHSDDSYELFSTTNQNAVYGLSCNGLAGIMGALLQDYEKGIVTEIRVDTERSNQKEEKKPLTPDLQAFVDGRIAVHITNADDYANFIEALNDCGIQPEDNEGYPVDYYDPYYPYYYMKDPDTLYMNANVAYENIVNHLNESNCNITSLVEYQDMDFVAEQEQEEEYELD
jgi:hypothetical protein